jgi:hypothetical protein
MMPFARISALVLAFAFIGPLARAAQPAKKLLDLYQAIAVAERAIVANKVDLSSIELVGVRRHRLPDNEIVPHKPTNDFERMLAAKLDKRIYWYVVYTTPGAEMGGQYGIFIDAKTGEVVYFYVGR